MSSIPRSSNRTWARPLVGAVGSALLGLVATAVLAARAPSIVPVRPGEKLAGFLPVTVSMASRWCWSGAWLYPIGDPHALGLPAPDGDPGYAVNRNIGRQDDGTFHQGADLCNRRPGGLVRAAAGGIVVRAALQSTNGYGVHVVIAHRGLHSPVVYSVYAHLLPGSVRVAAGDNVCAGQPIGRVGRSGHATADHLHFEIRKPSDPAARWENETPVDPVEFVTARLASARSHTAWDAPYLEWAECAGIVGADAHGDDRLTRREWRAMLARSARPPRATGPATKVWSTAGSAPDSGKAVAPIGWPELASDLARLQARGVRLPRCLVAAKLHLRTCRAQLDRERPSRKPKLLAARRSDRPTVADACLVLADLVVRAPRGTTTSGRGAPSKKPTQHTQPDSVVRNTLSAGGGRGPI